jgi:cytochrome c oxidase subunit 4
MAEHPQERPHPGPATYVQIAVVLAVITAVEVATFYIQGLGPVLIPLLLVLSAAKFALVVGYYMHLRFDSRLFTAFFVSGLLVAATLIIAFILLFLGHQA